MCIRNNDFIFICPYFCPPKMRTINSYKQPAQPATQCCEAGAEVACQLTQTQLKEGGKPNLIFSLLFKRSSNLDFLLVNIFKKKQNADLGFD